MRFEKLSTAFPLGSASAALRGARIGNIGQQAVRFFHNEHVLKSIRLGARRASVLHETREEQRHEERLIIVVTQVLQLQHGVLTQQLVHRRRVPGVEHRAFATNS